MICTETTCIVRTLLSCFSTTVPWRWWDDLWLLYLAAGKHEAFEPSRPENTERTALPIHIPIHIYNRCEKKHNKQHFVSKSHSGCVPSSRVRTHSIY